MLRRLGSHVRNQWAGFLSLFLVLAGGVAYAANTIGSGDIIDDSVRSVDLRNNDVRSADILDGSLRSVDVFDGSLTGTDVDESTLERVPSALTATQGGLGRYGSSGGCDPETDDFVICSTVQITLSAPARLFVNATALASTEEGANNAFGTCRIGTTSGPIHSSTSSFHFVDGGDTTYGTHTVSLIAVTPVFPPGTHTVGIDCNQTGYGAIFYPQARVVAVALSAA